MKRDLIVEVGINAQGKLYIVPHATEFPLIYREGMEVHWNADDRFLYSPKPREWTYVQWFKQLVRAAHEQSCDLYVDESTKWINVSPADKDTMISAFHTMPTEYT